MQGKVFPNICGDAYPESYSCQTERFLKITKWAWGVMISYGVSCVSLEGYAMRAQGNVFDIAENTQTLKLRLFESGIPLDIYPPSHIKKFATGKGNSNKDAMHDAFSKETGINLAKELTPGISKLSNPVTDIVDSYYIAKLLHTNMAD